MTTVSAKPAEVRRDWYLVDASGRTLGRLASAELRFRDLTALRFTVGLVTLGLIAGLTGTSVSLPWSLAPSLVLLALVPGLLALVLYYLALGRTPASRATMAELAFPLTAAVIGVVAFAARPSPTQWLGFAIVLVTVVALAIHEQRAEHPAVAAPVRAEDALRVRTR